ncbi:MAG: hypothetical protein GY827_08885, partial [Cytophagales bacterium]|nr:hypothetical protein [Cytophagales bacterium]
MHIIPTHKIADNISHLLEAGFDIEIQEEKHKFLILFEGEKIADIRLPLPYPRLSTPIKEYFENLPVEIPNYIIYIIQAGSCAMAYVEEENILEHKVFKTYMVRKKQGKSQIKHLKSKGKSKAGSRLRLANTINFLEQINERLQMYEEDYFIEKIIYSCPKNMISLFYESKTPPPFQKDDERLIKIPKDIQQPSYEELLKINKQMLQTEIIFYSDQQL